MTILSYNPDCRTLFVRGERSIYEYSIPAWYVVKVRGFVRRGFEGKAWQVLRKFKEAV